MATKEVIYCTGFDWLGNPTHIIHYIEVEDEPLIKYPEIKNKRKPLDIIKHRKFKAELKLKQVTGS